MTLPAALPATLPAALSAAPSGAGPATSADAKVREIDDAARAFEKLLVQRMLGDMRKATRDADASNAMSNWESMFDEEIAGIVTSRGGLGLGDALSRTLGGSGSVTIVQPRATAGLPDADVQALRGLVARAGEAGDGAAPVRRPDASAARASRSGPRVSGPPSEAPERADAGPEHGFVDSLRGHAERGARRLDTAPEAILAIAALETGWGRHRIVDERGADSHNLFGIKATGAARDDAVAHRTTEFIGGAPRKIEAQFARFDDAGAAVDGFADFVLDNPRYAPALAVATDPEAFLRELHRAGYATDPDYADKAIDLMHRVRALHDTRPEGSGP